MFVSPSFRRMVVVISRLPNVGRPPNPLPDMLLTAIFSVSDTSSSWCVRGVMSMLTPMFWYTNDVIGCWLTPPAAIGANVVDGHRDLLAEPRLRGQPFGGAQLRIRQHPRVRVVLEQPIVDGRAGREEHVRLGEVPERSSVRSGGVDVTDPAMPGDFAGLAQHLEAVLAQTGAIHFQQLDVDDDFGARLVDRADSRPAAAMRSGVSLIEMALVAVIGEMRRTSTTMRSRSITSLMSALLR